VWGPRRVGEVLGAGQGSVDYSPRMEDAVDQGVATVRAGEALITFGAGNVWMAGEEMLKRLRGKDSKKGSGIRVSQARGKDRS